MWKIMSNFLFLILLWRKIIDEFSNTFFWKFQKNTIFYWPGIFPSKTSDFKSIFPELFRKLLAKRPTRENQLLRENYNTTLATKIIFCEIFIWWTKIRSRKKILLIFFKENNWENFHLFNGKTWFFFIFIFGERRSRDQASCYSYVHVRSLDWKFWRCFLFRFLWEFFFNCDFEF